MEENISLQSPEQIVLTPSQDAAFSKLKEFIGIPSAKVFILKGYAGTGKTTLVKFLLRELKERELPYRLLASTGRAAKILSNATGEETATVHSCIYNFNGLSQDMDKMVEEREKTEVDETGQLFLNFGLLPIRIHQNQITYIVDEASMVSDKEDKNATQAIFGSGRLLKDLLEYDPTGKFIFVGDFCQLPPVIQKISPALEANYFKDTFQIDAVEAELTDIVRQEEGNDIVVSAQRVRRMYFNPQPYKWAKFPFRGYRNIHIVPNQMTLVSQYLNEIRSRDFNKATLIGFSNRQCDMITGMLRPALGVTSTKIAVGDLLLVTQNNYISGLMNGDQVVIKGIGNRERKANLTFVNVTVEEIVTKKTFNQLLVEEIIYENQTNLSQPQQKELMFDYYYRMKDKGIKAKSKAFYDNMMYDPYLNAIRSVYGYVLTCHKSQGGEWNKVFLDIPRNVPLLEKPYVYQWVYTAMTRAKQELYVVEDFWVM